MENLDYDPDEQNYTSIKKIYLPKGNTPLVILICYGETDARGPSLSVNFYDIDFELIGTTTMTQKTMSHLKA